MKSKLLLATFIVLNLSVSKSASAQANFSNKPLGTDRTRQSQMLKDFNRRVDNQVELLQINRANNRGNILNIPQDYEHLESSVDLFKNNIPAKNKASDSTIFYLDRDSQLILEQNWDAYTIPELK